VKNRYRVGIFLFLVPIIIVFLLFYLVPVVTVFVTSFTHWSGFGKISFAGFDNYRRLFFHDNTFFVAFRNLMLWCLITIVFHVPFGALIAFMLHKKPFGWKFVRAVFMIPNIITLAAWAIMYRFIFNNDFGIINNLIRAAGFADFSVNWFFDIRTAFFAVTLTWVFFSIVNTLLVLSALKSIPREIYESAYLDGATSWEIAFKIEIPMIKSALSTCMILSLAGIITQFEVIFITTRGGPGNRTFNLALMLYDGIMSNDFGYANAVAALMIIIGISILVITNKVFGRNTQW